MIMKNLYFVAHQDDELLNTGVLIVKESELYHDDTYVILCTDGGGSGVVNVLGNGESCWLHEGLHSFTLTRKDFSLARDKEFLASCRLLGVKTENIIIHKNRGLDASLTEGQAEQIILDTLKLFSAEDDFRVRAVSPKFHGRQNSDHKVIGNVCEKLFGEGLFSQLILVTDSCFEGNCREIFPETSYKEIRADDNAFEKLKAAANCYGLWDPQNGRYAVGLHSVKDEFEELIRNPRVIYEEKSI